MDISSIYESAGTTLFELIYGDKSKDASTEEVSDGVSSQGADTVSISPEAREKLAGMVGVRSEEDAQGQTDAETGSASGGGSSDGESGSKLESLKGKLNSLQAALGRAVDPEAAAITAQIAQVMTEIAALESEAA
jgi:hypothetical protein